MGPAPSPAAHPARDLPFALEPGGAGRVPQVGRCGPSPARRGRVRDARPVAARAPRALDPGHPRAATRRRGAALSREPGSPARGSLGSPSLSY